MIRILIAAATLVAVQPAWSQERLSQDRVPQEHSRAHLDALIVKHAAANGVPESLVRRVVVRESKYNARAVGRGGTMGLMQIKHATARGVGYTGSASGLLDPDTNLTYAVRYLAGAYRAAGGNESRAVSYYAGGYYHHAKRMGLTGKTYADKTYAGKTYAGKTYAAASAVSEPVTAPDVAAAAPLAAAPAPAVATVVPVKVGAPMVLVVAAPKAASGAKSKAKSAKASKVAPAAAPEAPVEAPEVDVAEAGADQPISAVSPADRDFPH